MIHPVSICCVEQFTEVVSLSTKIEGMVNVSFSEKETHVQECNLINSEPDKSGKKKKTVLESSLPVSHFQLIALVFLQYIGRVIL